MNPPSPATAETWSRLLRPAGRRRPIRSALRPWPGGLLEQRAATTPPEAMSTSAGVGPETLAADGPVKPRLRGVWHQYGFFASLVAGAASSLARPPAAACSPPWSTPRRFRPCWGRAPSTTGVTWQPRARRRMRRLDHAMIFVLIAGSYTPIVLLAMSGTLAVVVFCVAWGGALAGVLVEFFWTDHPRYVSAVIGTALGWTSLVMVGQLQHDGRLAGRRRLHLRGGPLHDRGDDLLPQAAGSDPGGVRLPRGLPRPRARGGGDPLRGDRLHGHAPRLTGRRRDPGSIRVTACPPFCASGLTMGSRSCG